MMVQYLDNMTHDVPPYTSEGDGISLTTQSAKYKEAALCGLESFNYNLLMLSEGISYSLVPI